MSISVIYVFVGLSGYTRVAEQSIRLPVFGEHSRTNPRSYTNKTRKTNQKTKAKGNLMMRGRARQILKEIEKTVKKEFTNVGKKFPEEARKASKGKRDEKIYGTATKKQIKELESEGIDIFPVPELKDN